ncbi:uncharacterized protein LOC130164900 [Seriola aureovittata]|uniref:uncharacterized protein LOC130164900 n=1 Tax=Seriola aureovittata TaxID=2871759 RepID=UPI0024BDAA56|nr:uncharacterized protein LOC130164900 [Seriola aureovittata]
MATPNAQQQHQDYFRSVSSESTTYMMVPAGGPSGTRRKEAPSKMWVAMVVIVVVVLQIASTTGLFVYLNMSISEVRSQGVTEELKCLSLLNALDKDQDIPDQLAQLFGEPCIKLAEGIKAYISKVRKQTADVEDKHSKHITNPHILVLKNETRHSVSVRSQGVTEELKCLSLLNALDKDQDIPDQLAQLFGEPCIKLAEGIKAYISKRY